MTAKIVSRVENGVGRIIFNNSEKKNAISIEMAKYVTTLIAEYEADPNIRVVIIQGEGTTAFVSGMDISEFEKLRSTPALIKSYEDVSDQMYQALYNCSKATIAMIRGYCMGGGVALACACDFRICDDSALFSIPAARLGIAYRPHFTKWVVNAVGPSIAKEILMLARRYDARKALEIGLVNHLVSSREIEKYITEYSMEIVNNAPLSVSANKAIVNEVNKLPGDWDENLCADWQQKCSSSEDYKEGRQAFMEKRSPIFKGR